MEQKVKVEAEGRELILKNSAGDFAIIPKNKRAEALRMLKDKCYGCLDSLIASLPKAGADEETTEKVEYARDGLTIPVEGGGDTDEEELLRQGVNEATGLTFDTETANSLFMLPEEASPQDIEARRLNLGRYEGAGYFDIQDQDTNYRLIPTRANPQNARGYKEQIDYLQTLNPDVNFDRYAFDRRPSTEMKKGGEVHYAEDGLVIESDNFGTAFRQAREELGAGKTFVWKGKRYTTNLREEEGITPSPEETTTIGTETATPIEGLDESVTSLEEDMDTREPEAQLPRISLRGRDTQSENKAPRRTLRDPEPDNDLSDIDIDGLSEALQKVEEDPIEQEFAEEEGSLDKKSFSQAFREKRKELGAGEVFTWRGNEYTTDYGEPKEDQTEKEVDEQLVEELGNIETNNRLPNEGLTGPESFFNIPMMKEEGTERENMEMFVEKTMKNPNINTSEKVDRAIKSGYKGALEKVVFESVEQKAKELGIDLNKKESKEVIEKVANRFIEKPGEEWFIEVFLREAIEENTEMVKKPIDEDLQNILDEQKRNR